MNICQGRRKVQKSGGGEYLIQGLVKKRVLLLFRVKSGGSWTPYSDGLDFLVLTELEDTPLQSPQAWPQIMMLLQIKENAFIDS